MREFLDVVKSRKSIRSFQDAPVDPVMVRDILTLATYAPTNCNQQLWNFIVVDDFSTKERLIKEAASNTLIRRAPVLVVVTYDGWNKKEAIQGASLAAGHIVLAAEYYGMGALPMNSYGADTKIKKILNIPETESICCFVLLGHPDELAKNIPLVPRRPVDETIHWGKFHSKRTPPFTYDPNDWSVDDLRNHQRYYCRKTFPGKEMDLASRREREVVRRAAHGALGPAVDLFSYDGSFLREFPDIPVTAVDLNSETMEYARSAAQGAARSAHVLHRVYDEQKKTLADGIIRTVTIFYKLERLSYALRDRIFEQAYATLSVDGSLIIVARKSNFFLSLFFFTIRFLFGNDVRKTGIYAYFGPYQPIHLGRTLAGLNKAGFRGIAWSGYFLIPSFYEQTYQMLVQYIRSEGSSYLHRDLRNDWISAFLAICMKIQGFRRFGRFGSVVVITCKK